MTDTFQRSNAGMGGQLSVVFAAGRIKLGVELLGAGELPEEEEDDPVDRKTCQAAPSRPG